MCVSVYIKSDSFTQADAITSLALRKDSARTLWGMNYDWEVVHRFGDLLDMIQPSTIK